MEQSTQANPLLPLLATLQWAMPPMGWTYSVADVVCNPFIFNGTLAALVVTLLCTRRALRNAGVQRQSSAWCEGTLSEDLLEESEMEDRTEAAVARKLDMGIGLTMSETPSLRVSWAKSLKPKGDRLKGQVTFQERLWGVIVTMGVAGLRARVLLDGNVVEYVLYFFCFYDAVMASIMYSTRFNDTDGVHRMMWMVFTMGMAGQCAYLYHDIRGFALSTGLLYSVIASAQLRVAYYLEEVRFLALHDALWNGLAAMVLSMLWFAELGHPYHLYALTAHALLRPLGLLSFWALTSSDEAQLKWDVPVNIWYMISRFEGLHMMIIVCSVLFPLGLAGDSFTACPQGAGMIMLGNFYALLLKISLHDVRSFFEPENLKFHAIWYGSRRRLFIYILVFPYSVLGIAITGVGLVAAPQVNADANWVRQLLSGGAFLTWTMLTIADACHGDRIVWGYIARIGAQLCGAFAFLLPLGCCMSPLATVIHITLVMACILTAQILIECHKDGFLPASWEWRTPQQRVKWKDLDNGLSIPVSTGEHFFTVLLAVVVLKLNIDVGVSRDPLVYILQLIIFYGVVWATMRYASQFSDDDLSHKFIWSGFEFVLLLMLQGLSTSDSRHWKLLNASSTMMFLVLALLFSGRAACSEPGARIFCIYCMCIELLCAGIFARLTVGHEGVFVAHVLLVIAAFLLLFSDVLFAIPGGCRRRWGVPMNREYVIARFNGLFMEVLGVAVIVPNAVYPGQHTHSSLVCCGDALAVKLAVSLKTVIFDVEPIDHNRHHAINLHPIRRMIYLTMSAFTIFALATFGAGIPLIIVSAGTHGLRSRDAFAQQLTCCASSLFLASMAITKFAHKSVTSSTVHRTKALVQVFGSLMSCIPLCIETTDSICLLLVVLIMQVNEWTQYWLCCPVPAAIAKSPEFNRRTPRARSLASTKKQPKR